MGILGGIGKALGGALGGMGGAVGGAARAVSGAKVGAASSGFGGGKKGVEGMGQRMLASKAAKKDVKKPPSFLKRSQSGSR